MTIDLRFSGALGPQPGGAVALVFGAVGDPPVDPPAEPPQGRLRMALATAWQQTDDAGARIVRAAWRAAASRRAGARAPWAGSERVAGLVGTGWGATLGQRRVVQVPWASTTARAVQLELPWGAAQALRDGATTRWRQAGRYALPTAMPWDMGQRGRCALAASWRAGAPSAARAAISARDGRASRTPTRAPWRTGAPVESIGGPWSPGALVPPAPTPCWLPDPGGAVGLLFRDAMPAGLVELIFACRRAALALVPIRRVYMVTNVTSLVRVSDDTEIPCLGLTLSLDVDSWAWGFSASLPASALALVEPEAPGEPVELAAWVNGTEFRVIAESLTRERSFGQASVRVQGRGATAALDAPYQPATVFSAGAALTSQQLADQAMPFGWTVDWSLTAWLVPGGIWSHVGTPISATVAIAAAGGGYVQPHASLQQVRVLPRYPVAPWAWAGVTPDLELPAAVTVRESIDWVEKARYNGVYVSGTTAGGVLRLVKRAGTAGDVLAQMVTDPLITHADAARQRGIPVLADTGRIATVALSLPVLPETAVIRPGQFVRYVDGATARLGLVRAVSVDVQGATVWQTIRVETHA